MTDDELAAIEARCEKATAGPWEDAGHTVIQSVNPWDDVIPSEVSCGAWCLGGTPKPVRESDRAFIAHARQDIPALLAEVRRLKAFHHYVVNDMQIDNGGRDDSLRPLIAESVAFFFADYGRNIEGV